MPCGLVVGVADCVVGTAVVLADEGDIDVRGVADASGCPLEDVQPAAPSTNPVTSAASPAIVRVICTYLPRWLWCSDLARYARVARYAPCMLSESIDSRSL